MDPQQPISPYTQPPPTPAPEVKKDNPHKALILGAICLGGFLVVLVTSAYYLMQVNPLLPKEQIVTQPVIPTVTPVPQNSFPRIQEDLSKSPLANLSYAKPYFSLDQHALVEMRCVAQVSSQGQVRYIDQVTHQVDSLDSGFLSAIVSFSKKDPTWTTNLRLCEVKGQNVYIGMFDFPQDPKVSQYTQTGVVYIDPDGNVTHGGTNIQVTSSLETQGCLPQAYTGSDDFFVVCSGQQPSSSSIQLVQVHMLHPDNLQVVRAYCSIDTATKKPTCEENVK